MRLQTEAKLRAAEHEARLAEEQRAEAISARRQETDALRIARGDVLSALVIAAELTPHMRKLVGVVGDMLRPDPVTGKVNVTITQAMALLTRHATLVQKAVGAAETVIQLSRLDRGETTANIGIVGELSEEEALAELAAAEEVLAVATGRKPVPVLGVTGPVPAATLGPRPSRPPGDRTERGAPVAHGSSRTGEQRVARVNASPTTRGTNLEPTSPPPTRTSAPPSDAPPRRVPRFVAPTRRTTPPPPPSDEPTVPTISVTTTDTKTV